MKLNTILMIIAIIILIINIILTIKEALIYYHNYYPLPSRGESGANSGRILGEFGASLGRVGAKEPGPEVGRVRINGMWYNVRWFIIGREGFIYEEKETK